MTRVAIERNEPIANPGLENARSIQSVVMETAAVSERERTLL